MDRTVAWTISSEQLRAFWKAKTMHLIGHKLEVFIHLTDDPKKGPVILTVLAHDVVYAPGEDVPNAMTRKRTRTQLDAWGHDELVD